MAAQLPYCGTPPSPQTLLLRFNLDAILIAILLGLAAVHWYALRQREHRSLAMAGWGIASLAVISPLCALSVALFAARVSQHMILILLAAPLLALGTPMMSIRWARPGLWGATLGFLACLWFWHMPAPYDATFRSTPVYWAMHLTLFGSAILLWRGLLRSPRQISGEVLLAGVLTSMQMGFLGAILAVASRPIYFAHLSTAQMWGLTPLQDQQLGGTVMWVPGIALFLWAGIYALGRLRTLADRPHSV